MGMNFTAKGDLIAPLRRTSWRLPRRRFRRCSIEDVRYAGASFPSRSQFGVFNHQHTSEQTKITSTRILYTKQNKTDTNTNTMVTMMATTTTMEEEAPVLQRVSLRGRRRSRASSSSSSSLDAHYFHKYSINMMVCHFDAIHDGGGHDDDNNNETARMPSVADIVPRPLTPWTVLSRSTLVMSPDLECQEVLRRIEALIRAKSLSYTVHLDSATIECRAGSCLSFALNVWQKSNRDNNYNNNNVRAIRDNDGNANHDNNNVIVVELQRRNGCGIFMHRVRKAFFHGLQTGEEPSTECLQRCRLRMTVSPRVKQMMRMNKRKSSKEYNYKHKKESCSPQNPEEEEMAVKESLQTCQALLQSEQDDHNQLGLELLVYMTDPQNFCAQTTTEKMAQSLLCENTNDDHNTADLHESFMHLLRRSTASKARRSSFQNKQSFAKAPPPPLAAAAEGEEEGQDKRSSVILSLTALSNALKVVQTRMTTTATATSTTSQDVVAIDIPDHSRRRIVSALKAALRDPQRFPEEAALSAQIIRRLEQVDPPIASALLADAELVERLVEARRVGETHYRVLERESQSLLQHLSSVQ